MLPSACLRRQTFADAESGSQAGNFFLNLLRMLIWEKNEDLLLLEQGIQHAGDLRLLLQTRVVMLRRAVARGNLRQLRR